MRLCLALGLFLFQAAGAAPSSRVRVLKISDSINIGVKQYITRGLEAAKAEKDPALLIELDTPGGFLEATRGIVQMFLSSEVPVIVWVTPGGGRAASAGSMITLAAHYAAMSPSTSIGAATPVNGGGGDIGGDMRAKIQNDTKSFVEGIAEKRGRNVEWARESVSKAASLNATEALKQKVIDGIHSSLAEVWAGARAKFSRLPADVEFVDLPESPKEEILSFVSNPNIAYGLLTIGGLGVYMELSHPGAVAPGAVGALCLALGAITMDIVPIRPGAIFLLILGIALLAVEMLTPLPTYGFAGVGAAISLFLSGVFLLDPAETNLQISAGFWLPSFFALVGFMVFIGYQAGRAIRSPVYAQGVRGLIGKNAEVISVSAPGEARILVQGEMWRALWHPSAPTGVFMRGQSVKVVEQKGLVAYVAPA